MKKILFIVVPLLLVGGGVVGLALMGIIKIPGLTPKKKHSNGLYGEAAGLYGELKDATAPKEDKKAEATKKSEAKPTDAGTQAKKPAAPTTDPEKGDKKLAKLWNDMESEKLKDLVKDWKDEDLAKVLIQMDNEKASQLLALLEPARSSKISRELQKHASIVKPVP